MNRPLVSALTLLALTPLLSAAPASERDDDPKDVAWRFAVAAQRGDIRAARGLYDGHNLDLFLDLLERMTTVRDALREAAVARFGEASRGLDAVQPDNAIRMAETPFPMAVAAAEVKTSGDAATLTSKLKGGELVVSLKRTPAGWRVVSCPALRGFLPLMGMTAGAVEQTADEVTAGKYQHVYDVDVAVAVNAARRMNVYGTILGWTLSRADEPTHAAGAKASTRPASRPSN